MAAEKTKKSKQKAAMGDGGVEGAPVSKPSTPRSWLRLRTDPRKEWRYEPAGSAASWLTMIGASVGAVLLGAGVYGQWLRTTFHPEFTDPHKYAMYFLLGGMVLVAGIALFGPRAPKPVRVGDAGVAIEKDAGEIERIAWRDVTRVLFDGGMLTFQSPGTVLAIPTKLHPQAAARAVSEARARIPAMLADLEVQGLPALDSSSGDVTPLEPPQLAGARCKASDELIAFEKDARLCGRCGEVYHKDHVPPRCATCDAKLK